MLNLDQLKADIKAIIPEITEIRHHLHANPELALEEHKTAAYLREQLSTLPLDVFKPALKTDVIAMLRGETDGPHIVLRADMDALPLQEMEALPYASKSDGIMHACGHDGHMSMLLGAAKILASYQSELKGSVRFVFQPGEEIVAAGRDLVETGVLDEPKPDVVMAMHGMPGMKTGVIGSRPGPLMAAADFFKLTITGKGGHGSMPETCVDPIYVATRVLNELYQIPSRQFSALDSLVISPCMITGGQNANIIPDEVYIEGTVRYLSKDVGAKIPEVFEAVVKGECEIAGAHYTLDYTRPYLPTINDSAVIDAGKATVTSALGEEGWVTIEKPIMGSEDFSFFLDRYSGAMFFIGNGVDTPSLHNQCFDFNDEVLENGILFFVASVLLR